MKNIILKYGGICTADTLNLKLVLKSINDHIKKSEKIFVVVSAPGNLTSHSKKFEQEKITDCLIELNKTMKSNGNTTDVWEKIKERFLKIGAGFGLFFETKLLLNEVFKQIKEKNDYDFTLSRGEFITANIIAKILNTKFLDAKDFILIKQNGEIDFKKSKEKLEALIENKKNFDPPFPSIFVVPGFYGATEEGEIKIFTRDGTDFTAAIVANLTSAEIYKNIKDVNGLMTAAPRIVKNPKQVYKIAYCDLRVLTNDGAKILHNQTISPIVNTNTKLEISNLFKNKKSTIAVKEKILSSHGFVSITGKENLTLLEIEKSENELLNIPRIFETILSYAKLVNIHFENEKILLVLENFTNAQKADSIQEEIKNKKSLIYSDKSISQLSLVGVNHKKKIIKRIKKALKKSKIELVHISTSDNARTVKILINNNDFKSATLAIYNEFYKKFGIIKYKFNI